MKRLILTLFVLSAFCNPAHAGSQVSDKDIKQVAPPPCPEFYKDNEWNVSLWGTYAFTGTEHDPNLWIADLIQSTTEGKTVLGTYDKYLGGDHAWGGGADIKYFFHRYFGIGIEGFAVDAEKGGFDLLLDPRSQIYIHEHTRTERAIGSALGTFTLRYPVPCTRFAPYAWAGGGAIFGGGESDTVITHPIAGLPNAFPTVDARSRHYDGETRAMAQFGAGLEVRITPHIGWINDFAWNVVDGPKNDFGMFRSGLNFAF
jgi:hypothetical protein